MANAKDCRRACGYGRRGAQTLEVILTLPLVVLTLMSGLQFGIAAIHKQTIQYAATVAAQEATLDGGVTAVQNAVNAVLATHDLQIGPGVTLLVEDATGLRYRIGDAAFDPAILRRRSARPLAENEIRAILYVARDATAIPERISLMEQDVEHGPLIAVATTIDH